MTNDLFGSLGGLMGGFSGLMPQDDPNVKLLAAQNELDKLKQQEAALYSEIGRFAYERDGAAGWPDQAEKLRLVQLNKTAAEEQLAQFKQQKNADDKAKQEADNATRCPSCGHSNPTGTKFCQECGAKLGASHCTSCGEALQPGTRFCGACGAAQPGV